MQGLTETLQFEMDRGQLANFQLRLGDRHSMAAGLEVRVPFLGSAHRSQAHLLPLNWRLSADDEKMALREAAALTDLPREIVRRPKVPAGTATSPSLVATLIDELRPRAEEWALEYGRLTPQLLDQPDMAIGLRLFHAMHFTDAGTSIRSGSLLDVLEDVGPWPTQ
jgi:asparagine synthetase B (glutamine-hydrolysing)